MKIIIKLSKGAQPLPTNAISLSLDFIFSFFLMATYWLNDSFVQHFREKKIYWKKKCLFILRVV